MIDTKKVIGNIIGDRTSKDTGYGPKIARCKQCGKEISLPVYKNFLGLCPDCWEVEHEEKKEEMRRKKGMRK